MPRLPELVTLPAGDMIEAAELRTALGASRAVLHLWRKRHGFPASHRCGVRQLTCAAAVEAWLLARGVPVARVAP